MGLGGLDTIERRGSADDMSCQPGSKMCNKISSLNRQR
jgi:hypothetical protein